jgi:hypothetical protein
LGAFGSDQGLVNTTVYLNDLKWHGRGRRFDPDQVHQSNAYRFTAFRSRFDVLFRRVVV